MAVELAPDYDVVLSPWPPGGEDLAERSALHFATSTLKDAIQPGASDTVFRRLGETAAAMVERYAPGAPRAVRNEAVIRFAAYLAQTPKGGITKIGTRGVDIEFSTNHAGMFRNSGAAALLSPWKVRRAGVI